MPKKRGEDMGMELAKTVEQVLGALATFTKSLEQSVKSFIRTSGTISSSLEKRRVRKIADALATFYFTPVGMRKDLEIYINDPSHENFELLERKLEDSQEIIRKFERSVYENVDSNLFRLPMSDIDYLFGVKSKLWDSVYRSRYEVGSLSIAEKQEFLDEMKQSFEKFNRKLQETIKNLCDFADQVENGEKTQ
jgi:hypothetical protein